MSLQPFQWIEIICLKAAESLQGDSLILTAKSQGVPDTRLVGVTRMCQRQSHLLVLNVSL